MIKKKIKYIDVEIGKESYEEVEKEAEVRFLFSISALRLYEQKTNRNFFKDNEKALIDFSEFLGEKNITDVDKLKINEQIKLLPVVSISKISNFLLNVIPCFYTKIFDGKFIQNEATYEECMESLWLTELINLEFFIEIMEEVSKFETGKTPKKKRSTQKK